MRISKELSSHEQSALKKLESIEKYFIRNPFDTSLIVKRSTEYYNLRNYISVTAGGLRRRNLHRLNNNSDNSEPQRKDKCLNNLITKGWHPFNVDQEILIKLRRHINQQQEVDYNLATDQIFQQLSLRLVPSSIYKSIKLYLGSRRFWIYPRNLLRSESMEMKDLSIRQKSDLAFSFHRDIDSTSSVKVFVNLNNSRDGSHEFVQSSHSTMERSVGESFQERMSHMKRFEQQFFAESIYETFVYGGRFDSSSLMSIFPKEDFIQMPTYFGAAWVEDTYGLHRGTPCSDTDRCLLSISIGAHPIRVE